MFVRRMPMRLRKDLMCSIFRAWFYPDTSRGPKAVYRRKRAVEVAATINEAVLITPSGCGLIVPVQAPLASP